MGEIGWARLWPEGETSPGWSHSGIAVLADGRLAFADPLGGVLVLFDERSGAVQRIPTPLVELHGMTREAGTTSEDVLWVADPGAKARPSIDAPTGYASEERAGQVARIGVQSGTVTLLPVPRNADGTPVAWRPTSVVNVAADNGTESIWVADGYGESLVYCLAPDGSIRFVLDGTETGAHFNCPHGLGVSTWAGESQLVVADRVNARLLCYTLAGVLARTIEHPLFSRPSSLATRRGELLATDLDGALLGVSADGSVRAIVPFPVEPKQEGWPNDLVDGRATRPPLPDGVLSSPHGIAVGIDPPADVYLTEWVIGGRLTRLTLGK